LQCSIDGVRIADLRHAISQLSFVAGTVVFPLSLPHGSNRASVALGGAGSHEVAPGAGMPRLLNRLSLHCELSLERSGVDGFPESELS
jgi:hypothetical protein